MNGKPVSSIEFNASNFVAGTFTNFIEFAISYINIDYVLKYL